MLHPFYEKHAKHMPEVTCVLNSCSTGKRGGIAQTLSRTGISVFAPDDVCHLTELNLRNRDGKFFVSPTYSHDARTVHYLNGKEMFRKSAKEMPKTGLIYQYHE